MRLVRRRDPFVERLRGLRVGSEVASVFFNRAADATQLVRHVLGRLISFLRALSQRLTYYVLKGRWQFGSRLAQRLGFQFKYCDDNFARLTASERTPASQHLIKNDAETPQVRALIGGLAA